MNPATPQPGDLGIESLQEHAIPSFQVGRLPSLWDRVLPDALFIHDHDGRVLEVNRKACESLGYTRAELLAMNVTDLEPDFDLVAAQEVWGRIKSGVTEIVQGRQRRKDGTVFPVEVHFALLEESGRRIYIGSVRDVSERFRAEAVLRDRAAQLRSAFQAMSEGLVLQTLDGTIIDANTAAEVLLGLTRDQLLGKTSLDPAWQAIREDETPFPGSEHPAMVTARTGAAVRNQIMGVRDPKTGLRWISINAQPVFATDGNLRTGVICTFVDVTEQRRLTEELHASRERIRSLAQRQETVREDERKRVSRILHERIAQDLFAMSMWIQQLATDAKIDPANSEVDQAIVSAVDGAIKTVRSLADELRPDMLTHLPLTAGLNAHARQCAQRTGLQIRVVEKSPKPRIDEESRLVLFRAAQELLTNVARHARAANVEISLRVDAQCLIMDVSDDGIGIEPSSVNKDGALGLLGIQERLRALGGTFQARRNEPSGTTVSIAIPLKGLATRADVSPAVCDRATPRP